MGTHNTDEPGLLGIDEDALALYRWTLLHGVLNPAMLARAAAELALTERDCRTAAERLVGSRLFQSTAVGQGRLGWAAVSPQVAAVEVLSGQDAELRALEADLRDRRERVRSSREGYAALMPLYLQGRQQTYPQGMIDLVPDKFAVRALLDDTVSACRTEILISKHGGAFSPSSLEEALPRDLELLGRGVSMRSLYQHATRFDPATRAHALRLIDAGARIRTQTEVLPKIIIVDAETAFLRARDGGALVIREPALLSYLITTFERDWESATPYATGPRMAHEISQTLKQHILVLLAKGLKDEAIARRVGISLRTCRRHVSELLESLGAHSRFQAGVIAERHGLTTPSSLPADADLPQSQPAAPEPVPAPAPAAAGPDRSCPGCGRPLPVAGPVGRPARYCSSRCRSRAYRARRRDGAAERDEIARPRDEMPVARPPFER